MAVIVGSVATHDFGDVGTSSWRIFWFEVTNVGGAPTEPLHSHLEGTNASDFYEYNPAFADGLFCWSGLAPGGSCSFGVAFQPRTVGPKSAKFVVSAGPLEAAVMLVATAVPEAHLDITGGGVIYPVHVGATSPDITFTITNDGTATTGSLDASLTGTDASSFEITSNTCGSLAPAATCTISVAFHATAAGTRIASLRIMATPGGSVSNYVYGTGTNDNITLTPTSTDFSNVTIGLKTRARTFSVTNTTTAPSDPLAIALDGANAAQFGIRDDGCSGLALAAGATCTVGVQAAATVAGSLAANLRATAATTGSAVATLTATGMFNSFSIISTSLATGFGTVMVGQTSTAQTITVMNTSFEYYSGPLQLSLIGPNASQFVIANDGCNLTDLGPRTMCTVDVQFQPTATGAVGADLMIVGGNGSSTVALAGTGS